MSASRPACEESRLVCTYPCGLCLLAHHSNTFDNGRTAVVDAIQHRLHRVVLVLTASHLSEAILTFNCIIVAPYCNLLQGGMSVSNSAVLHPVPARCVSPEMIGATRSWSWPRQVPSVASSYEPDHAPWNAHTSTLFQLNRTPGRLA